MIRRNDGFTMIELLVAVVVFLMAMVAASNIFTSLVGQFKQQSKITETNVEGIVGLEMLRQDMQNAGFGLPWELGVVTYDEADGVATGTNPASFNDDSPDVPPRGFVVGDNLGTNLNGSDYLVIKATNVAMSSASQKWSYGEYDEATAQFVIHNWAATDDELENNSSVIVLSSNVDSDLRTLKGLSNTYDSGGKTLDDTSQYPAEQYDYVFVYGADPDTSPLRMPFNRADYYISTTDTPQRCAAGTGVLVKSVIEQNGGGRGGGLPVVDCVADFQVIFGLDNDENGSLDGFSSSLAGLTAEQIRNRVREVRAYVLAHEGQMDRTYKYPNNIVSVIDPDTGIVGQFDLSSLGADYIYYRWKVYQIIVNPRNLSGSSVS